MKLAIKIKSCNDGMMWYRDYVGRTVPYLRTGDNLLWSVEEAGYSNIIKMEEAEIIEVEDAFNEYYI